MRNVKFRINIISLQCKPLSWNIKLMYLKFCGYPYMDTFYGDLMTLKSMNYEPHGKSVV